MSALPLEEVVKLLEKAKMKRYHLALELASLRGQGLIGPPGCRGYSTHQEVLSELQIIEKEIVHMQSQIEALKEPVISKVCDEIMAISKRIGVA